MRFERCEYFQILDTENRSIKILENKGLEADDMLIKYYNNELAEQFKEKNGSLVCRDCW